MSGDEIENDEGDEENVDDANFHDDDYEESNDNEEFFDSNSDMKNIELSERGQQILRRININYQSESMLFRENHALF